MLLLTQCLQYTSLLVLAMLLPLPPFLYHRLPFPDSLKYQPAPEMKFAQAQQLNGSPRRPVSTLILIHNRQCTIVSRRHAIKIPMHGKHPTLATLAQHKQAAVKVKDTVSNRSSSSHGMTKATETFLRSGSIGIHGTCSASPSIILVSIPQLCHYMYHTAIFH